MQWISSMHPPHCFQNLDKAFHLVLQSWAKFNLHHPFRQVHVRLMEWIILRFRAIITQGPVKTEVKICFSRRIYSKGKIQIVTWHQTKGDHTKRRIDQKTMRAMKVKDMWWKILMEQVIVRMIRQHNLRRPLCLCSTMYFRLCFWSIVRHRAMKEIPILHLSNMKMLLSHSTRKTKKRITS